MKTLLLFLLSALPAAAAPLAYVTNEVAGTVTIFDTATNQVVSTVRMTPAGARPRGIQLTADGKRVYIALSDIGRTTKSPADAIVALDSKTFKEIQRFDAGSDPERFVVTRDGKRLYTANGLSNDVSVIDTASFKVIATIPAGKGAWGVEIGR